MKFHCLVSDNPLTGNLLKEACERKGIEFVPLEYKSFDLSDYTQLSNKDDLFYRASTNPTARTIEQLILSPQTTTFYSTYQRATTRLDNVILATIRHHNAGLPIPPTIFALTNNKEMLKKYADKLELPLIMKAVGGSHGVGVIKVDSLSSLFSVSDYLVQEIGTDFILRKFINVKSSARLIVLGGQVVDSIEYQAPEGDFRSNEGHEPNVRAMKFSDEINDIAIKSVSVLDLEFGGVDILIDSDGKPYITEVNFPCFFPRAQMVTGVSTAERMVEYLIKKSQGI